MYIYMHICTCSFLSMYAHTYIYMYIYINIYINIYIYIYLYICIHIDGLEMCDKLAEEIKRGQGCDDILYLIAAVDQVNIYIYIYTHLY
jgi:hypothetical protein